MQSFGRNTSGGSFFHAAEKPILDKYGVGREIVPAIDVSRPNESNLLY